jgi:LemA protein
MSKSSIITIVVILGILLIAFFIFQGRYNKIVTLDEEISEKWSQVENNYQRRLDLIPNLVNTVKGYADFEQETLTAVVEARSKASSVTLKPEELNTETLRQFQAAQDGLSSALSRLLVVVERYPDLKANQNFLDLQAQLEGTENRIANARRKFNESTFAFNSYIRRFPSNLLAAVFGFEVKPYFEGVEGAEDVPEVNF